MLGVFCSLKKLAIEGEEDKTYSEDRWQLFIWGSYRRMLPSIKIDPEMLFSPHIFNDQSFLKRKNTLKTVKSAESYNSHSAKLVFFTIITILHSKAHRIDS